jgi:enamine deaminase RidA (YjgF/YER057c/UK114 family)
MPASTTIKQRLTELGIELPAGRAPAANYVPVRRLGSAAYISGHTSKDTCGKVGADVSTEEAYAAARAVAISMLGTLSQAGIALDRVRVVKLLGMVNSAPDFTSQPAVINGASDLFLAVLGEENGAHARSAVGVAQLPGNAAVEVEAIVEVF